MKVLLHLGKTPLSPHSVQFNLDGNNEPLTSASALYDSECNDVTNTKRPGKSSSDTALIILSTTEGAAN